MAEENENTQPQEGSETADSGAGGEQVQDAGQARRVEGPIADEYIDKDARMWAMFCHLGGLAAFVLPIVVSGIIAPLIIWQIRKENSPFIDEQGKEAVNFQISVLLYALAGSLICLITCIGAPLMLIVVPAVAVFDLVFLLIAAVKANNGEHYRYPLTIRFVK